MALSLFAVGLAACGSEGESPGGATSARTAAAEPFVTTAGSGEDGSGGTLVVGMTASSIPSLDTMMSGAQGYEGFRFVGDTIYDGLTRLDLSSADHAPELKPALAVSWTPNKDATKWRFTLRDGVTFTDGTPWNADAAVFNLERFLNPDHPQSNPVLSGVARSYMPLVVGARKIDDRTIEVTSRVPNSHLPDDLMHTYMASPAAVKRYGGRGYAMHPVGTGPFKFDSLVRDQQLTLVPNDDYWRGAPKLDRLVLRPLADPTARTAALRSGEVNWIEYPMPDDIASLRAAGFQILTNAYGHIWPWNFDLHKRPWNDVRVRQAANYAINRDSLVDNLLHGTADPALQVIPVGSRAYSADDDRYGYDPEKARQLLADAGYPDGFRSIVKTPISGSGNMIPGPMNEALQQDLAAVGIDVELRPTEWATVLNEYYSGKFPEDVDAINISLPLEGDGDWAAYFRSDSFTNAQGYKNKEVDRLLAEAQLAVDGDERYRLYTEVGRLVTEDAPWLFVVNDRAPRALAPDVNGFVQPRSWFVDLTTTWVG